MKQEHRSICSWLMFVSWIMVALVLASCRQPTPPPGDEAEVPKPVDGGTLVYGYLEEPDNLNAYGSSMTYALVTSMLITNGLTTVNPDLEVQADLAKEVPTAENGGISEDGLTVTYELQEGVTWHDGTDFTCDDVKFTADTINTEAFIMPLSKAGYDKIAKTDCEDDHTVVFQLKEPYAPFVSLLFQWGIMPKHVLEGEADINKADYNRAPIGTGPFKFVEWQDGDHITLEKNEDYWDKKQQPHLDKVIIKFAEDENTILTQVKTGEIDVWDFVPASFVAQLEKEDVEVSESLQLTLESVHVNSGKPPLDDKRVRQALTYAWDRETTVEKIYPGQTLAVTQQAPQCWCANDDLEAYAYDPDLARELLEEAGWTDTDDDGFVDKDGKRLTLTISTVAGKKDREQVEAIMQDDYKKAGIELLIKNYDASSLFGDYSENGPLATGQYDLALYADAPGADPDSFDGLLTSDQIPSDSNPSGSNWNFFSNKELDSLVAEGRTTVQESERKKIYDRIQEIVYEESPFLFERFHTFSTVNNSRVHGITSSPTYLQNMWDHGANWWVDAQQ